MPPPIVTAIVEIEFVPGSGFYTGVTNRAIDVRIVRPRSAPGEPVAPTTLEVTLKNHPWTQAGVGFGFCPFVPDSPASFFYPNVARDRRIRVTAQSGASSWVRFHGFIDKWEPTMSGDGGAGKSTTKVTASCVLGRYARQTVLSYYGETVLNAAHIDYWPFDDPTDSGTVRGLSGDPVTYPARDGLVVVPQKRPGSLTLSEPDGGHLGDGQIDLSRGDDNTPSPVVLLTLRPGVLLGSFAASYRLNQDPAGFSDDVVVGYNAAGERLWRWVASLTGGTIVWSLFDDGGTLKSFYDTGSPRDDAWHYWQVRFLSSTVANITSTDKGGARESRGSFAFTIDPRPVRYIVIGGQMPPLRKGKQSNTLMGGVSSFMVQYASGTVNDYSEFIVPAVRTDADRVALFLNTQGSQFNSLTGGASTPVPGTDTRQLMYTNDTDTLLDRWNEHVRTTGGRLQTRPSGVREYVTADTARPLAVSLTLDAADDLDIPSGGWTETEEERPTRITAVGPIGSVTLVDDAAEALLGMVLEGPTVQTSAGDLALAMSVASQAMGAPGSRLAAFGIDLTLAGTDKTADVMTLLQGERIRVTGLPTEYSGVSYQEVYATSWSEYYGGRERSAVFVFDTDPADAPPEGVADDAEYGRTAWGDGVATVTGGTCVGNTGTGTVIITSSSPASTTGGDYPVDLDWNGERITVTAPGGGTSPQTFPVTARGVAPSVARVHSAGETVDAWHAATAAL